MRVLIGCECSGVVRRACRDLGYDAWSNDLVPSWDDSPYHIVGDVCEVIRASQWDAAILHPPCTRLTSAGARWFKGREKEQESAIAMVEFLWQSPVAFMAIENPVGVLSTKSKLGKPSQIIQPWQFGHGETKATCLWLRGFPLLQPTNVVEGRIPRIHYESPGMVNGRTRAERRSETYAGIAQAMATQWTPVVTASVSISSSPST